MSDKGIPPQDDIDALITWREKIRPKQCQSQTPCWVIEPYQAAYGHRVGCAGCGGIPSFNAVLFLSWQKEQK